MFSIARPESRQSVLSDSFLLRAQMLRDSADNSAHTEWRLGHFAGHTRKRESCHGKRSNAQQSRSQETEARQEVGSGHFAFGRAAHPGNACFVDDNEEALSQGRSRPRRITIR
jgi:hypothetical protein